MRVTQKDASASLAAAVPALSYEFEIEFSAAAIGRQTFRAGFFAAPAFAPRSRPARTFGFLKELEGLHALNLARGASLENTLALDESGVVNPEPDAVPGRIRAPQDPGRHRRHGAGGRAAAGAVRGHRSGHATNNALLRALFADPANYSPRNSGLTDPFLSRGRVML